MKQVSVIAFLLVLSVPAFAQLQVAKGDTIGTNNVNRVQVSSDASGRVGQKGSTGNFAAFALKSEVVAASGSAVTQVNGLGPIAGNVTVTTTNVAEGSNLYSTPTRTRAALSASGPISFNTGTGAFTWAGTAADVGLANVNNTSDAAKPISTLTQTALNAKEPSIPTGTALQYIKGDKTLGTHDKAAVGLSLVDNTSDAGKPVSTLQQSALDLKANTASSIFRDDVATHALLDSYTVPAGKTYLIKVATDSSYPAPYNVNQWYLKDASGVIFKLTLNKEN